MMKEYVIENWEQILTVLGGIVMSASAVAALTPNKTDNKILGAIRKLVDLLALNVRNAKNKPGK